MVGGPGLEPGTSASLGRVGLDLLDPRRRTAPRAVPDAAAVECRVLAAGFAMGTSTIPAPHARASRAGFSRKVLYALAAQDWLLLGYFFLLGTCVVAVNGPHRDESLLWIGVDTAVLAAGLLACRGELLPERAGTVLYRAAIVGTLVASFLQLKGILADFAPRAVDAQLLALDQRVFGVEPALAWDRLVLPWTTEYFSFFYFSYYFLLATHVLPIVFATKDARSLAEFSLGILLVFCVAHVVYMLVPAFGPYRHVPEAFEHTLRGGPFWRAVWGTVATAGAQMDCFPSVHTAAPTFLSIYSFHRRRVAPFKYTWPVTVLFTSQIIVATMFLRWHYLIDILAGVTLASSAALVAGRVVRWEEARRAAVGAPPVWRWWGERSPLSRRSR